MPRPWCLQGEVNQRVSSCPCVENVQGSLLIPVHVKREVQLRGRNLWLFQVCLPIQLTTSPSSCLATQQSLLRS